MEPSTHRVRTVSYTHLTFPLQAAKQFFQVGTGWQEPVDGRFQLCLIAGAVLSGLMFNIALALVLSWDDDGQTVFLAKPVGGTADIRCV